MPVTIDGYPGIEPGYRVRRASRTNGQPFVDNRAVRDGIRKPRVSVKFDVRLCGDLWFIFPPFGLVSGLPVSSIRLDSLTQRVGADSVRTGRLASHRVVQYEERQPEDPDRQFSPQLAVPHIDIQPLGKSR